jgi:hypothetical protein
VAQKIWDAFLSFAGDAGGRENVGTLGGTASLVVLRNADRAAGSAASNRLFNPTASTNLRRCSADASDHDSELNSGAFERAAGFGVCGSETGSGLGWVAPGASDVGFRAGCCRPLVSVNVSNLDTSPWASSLRRPLATVVGETPTSCATRRLDMPGFA